MNSKGKTTRPMHRTARTILLVDDDPSVREMIGRVLTDEGYHVLKVASGYEAIALASSHSIDLVLLDLNMPGKGGWDTFECITSENPYLAVIIITAKPGQLFTSLAAGVGALLEKPLDFNLLLKTVSDLLNESAELRLTRLTGHGTAFHYHPSTGKELGT
jgi:CheY-like chemotaxis protein